uniref:Uncharacterized protein n=1 Tax=Romanomermis culicivorax TaxID=13658 RepID=A0A915IUR9_ROMCU
MALVKIKCVLQGLEGGTITKSWDKFIRRYGQFFLYLVRVLRVEAGTQSAMRHFAITAYDHFNDFKNFTYDLATNFDLYDRASKSRFGVAIFDQGYRTVFGFQDRRDVREIRDDLKELYVPDTREIQNSTIHVTYITNAIKEAVEKFSTDIINEAQGLDKGQLQNAVTSEQCP